MVFWRFQVHFRFNNRVFWGSCISWPGTCIICLWPPDREIIQEVWTFSADVDIVNCADTVGVHCELLEDLTSPT